MTCCRKYKSIIVAQEYNWICTALCVDVCFWNASMLLRDNFSSHAVFCSIARQSFVTLQMTMIKKNTVHNWDRNSQCILLIVCVLTIERSWWMQFVIPESCFSFNYHPKTVFHLFLLSPMIFIMWKTESWHPELNNLLWSRMKIKK